MPAPRLLALACAAVLVLSVGCAPAADELPDATYDVPTYELATRADTVAMRTYDALGGPEAWASLPVLRFDFAFERDGARQTIASHLWDRRTGDYRVEWQGGADSVYVALFDVDTREGTVYLNGEPAAEAEQAALLERAYGRFINDTYWFLMPIKMLDDGVTRTYMPDSSSAGTEVVQLAFDDVGLTPGDRYWVYVDTASGEVSEWAYQLQGGGTGRFRWTGYEEHPVPAGTVRVATRKEAADGSRALLTDNVAVMNDAPDGAFTDPQPRFLGGA